MPKADHCQSNRPLPRRRTIVTTTRSSGEGHLRHHTNRQSIRWDQPSCARAYPPASPETGPHTPDAGAARTGRSRIADCPPDGELARFPVRFHIVIAPSGSAPGDRVEVRGKWQPRGTGRRKEMRHAPSRTCPPRPTPAGFCDAGPRLGGDRRRRSGETVADYRGLPRGIPRRDRAAAVAPRVGGPGTAAYPRRPPWRRRRGRGKSGITTSDRTQRTSDRE